MNPVVVLALFVLAVNALVLVHILMVEWRRWRAQNEARRRLHESGWVGKRYDSLEDAVRDHDRRHIGKGW